MFIRIVVNAMALGLVTFLLTGIRFDYSDALSGALQMLGVAAIFSLMNSFVKPFLHFFGTCFIILTFGLFLWVINAAMLMLTSWASGLIGLGWSVDGWGPAFFGALLLTIISVIATAATSPAKDPFVVH